MSAGLTNAERLVVLSPCACGHNINDHGELAGCWSCPDQGDECSVSFESMLAERVARIKADAIATARAEERARWAPDDEESEDRGNVVEVWTRGYVEGRAEERAAHERMADAAHSLVEPPRPAEPTTWGVVEASCVHSDERRNWIHHDDGNWWPAEKYGDATAHLDKGRDPRLPDDWDSLLQPVVIREGVTS